VLLKDYFSKILYACLFGSLIFILGSFFQSYHWFFELCVHFILQYSLALFLFALGFVFLKYYKTAVACALLSATMTFQVIGGMGYSTHSNSLEHVPSLNILSINLLSSNFEFNKANQYIQSVNADVLLLIEYTTAWDQNLLLDDYSYHIKSIREDNFGIALFSKIPFEESKIIDFTNTRFPFAYTALNWQNETLHILGAHFENPIGDRASSIRDFQMKASALFLRPLKGATILIGDFNCTPYSTAFKTLKKQANLIDTRAKNKINASWPSFFLPLMIPIDHALISPDLRLKKRMLGADVGSDHKPLYIELVRN